MRIDIPYWFTSESICENNYCITQTQTFFVNILEPANLFWLSMGITFSTITIIVSKIIREKIKNDKTKSNST